MKDTYVARKMKWKPFKSVGEIRSKRKLQLIHSDVVDQCLQIHLVKTSTLSLLLMTFHDAVQSIF